MQSPKDKAVRFTRDVLGDAERAEEIEAESLEGYAARRHIQLSNPWHGSQSPRSQVMPSKTIDDYKAEIRELKAEVRELEEENEDLQERFDQIADIMSPEDEG